MSKLCLIIYYVNGVYIYEKQCNALYVTKVPNRINVQNDPVNFIDPYGMFGLAGAISGLIGGGIGGFTVGYATTGDVLGGVAGAISGAIIGGGFGAVTGPQGGISAGTIGSGIVTGFLGELSGPTPTNDEATQRVMDSGEWWENDSFLQDIENMLSDPIWDKLRNNQGACN